MQLKDRFIEAVISGELGKIDDYGVTVSLKEFKKYFSDIKSDYLNSFLPAATIEVGQYSATHTKFVFRVKKGLYRVHNDLLKFKNKKDIKESKERNYTLSDIPKNIASGISA